MELSASQVKDILSNPNRNSEDQHNIITYFLGTPFFASFENKYTTNILNELFTLARCTTYPFNAIVFKQGDIANDEMYIVLDGCISVNKRSTEFNQFMRTQSNMIEDIVPNGNAFGEMSVLCLNQRRTFTAKATMETTLVILTLNALHRAKRACRDMPVQVVIPKPLPPRPNTILGKKEFMRNNDILKKSARKLYYQGDIVSKQGQRAQVVYFIQEGRCQMIQNSNLKLGYVESNDLIGLESMIESYALFELEDAMEKLILYNTSNALKRIEQWFRQRVHLKQKEIRNRIKEQKSLGSNLFDYIVVSEEAKVLSNVLNYKIIIINLNNFILCLDNPSIKQAYVSYIKRLVWITLIKQLYNYRVRQQYISQDDKSLIKDIKERVKEILLYEIKEDCNAQQQIQSQNSQYGSINSIKLRLRSKTTNNTYQIPDFLSSRANQSFIADETIMFKLPNINTPQSNTVDRSSIMPMREFKQYLEQYQS